MFKNIFFAIVLITFPLSAYAHISTGMVGFEDGLSHPVLGIDHFLAMVSVGVVSAQIGGRAIWSVPATFVIFMLIGGVMGIAVEVNQLLESSGTYGAITNVAPQIIEWGIILSVIFLGLAITIEKKLPIRITMLFVAVFGIFHGMAHGLEMPWAANPVLFAAGFVTGTATLHLIGVGIGMFLNKGTFSALLLRTMGAGCAVYGLYLLLLTIQPLLTIIN